MLYQHSKTVIALAIIALFAVTPSPGQAPKKDWKDRAEYDLYDAITKEQNAGKKLELLNSWKEKYPASDFKSDRLKLYLFTYQQLNQALKMFESAQELLAADPKEPVALYWSTILTPSLGKATPDILDAGEKSANGLQANIDAMKPANMNEDAWKKGKPEVEALAHKTLGWVAMQRKNNEAAEQEFRKSLGDNANAGEVSYWLGTVILAQKKVDKYPDALFHFARAASYDGPGALTAQGRAEVNKYFEKVYGNFHGSLEGVDELRKLAKSAALPPEGFKIESSNEIAIKKEEEFKKSNPMLALWMSVKKELTGANGAGYFESSVKGAGLPGGAGGVEKFKGKLISMKPAKNPKELVIGIADANTPEVTLKLDEALTGVAEPGTEISFEGVASAFASEPFMLTFDVEKAKLAGWPKQAPPAKKAGGAKKAAPPAKKAVKK